MSNRAKYEAAIKERVRDCEIQARAFTIWLFALSPANLVLVAGAALLSLVAGASILVKSGVVTEQYAAYLALLSAALTVIHNQFGCDAHQSECTKLRAAYEALRVRYHSLELLTDEADIRRQLAELDAKLATIKESATATPAAWSLAIAKTQR